MGAVRMRVQTADKYITIIHTTPVHQFKFLWSQKPCVFKKQIHNYDVLNLKPLLLAKIIHNNASWSELGEKSAQIKHSLHVKTALN